MKIAISDGIDYALNVNYRTIDLESTDFTNIAAIVVTMADLPRIYAEIDSLGFPIPIFVALPYGDVVPDEWLSHVHGVLELADDQKYYIGLLVRSAAGVYVYYLEMQYLKELINNIDIYS